MEKLADLDVNGNETLDLSEVFKVKGDVATDEYNEDIQKLMQGTQEAAEKDKELKKGLEEF